LDPSSRSRAEVQDIAGDRGTTASRAFWGTAGVSHERRHPLRQSGRDDGRMPAVRSGAVAMTLPWPMPAG